MTGAPSGKDRMKNSIKGVLLSGLVFPGLGQLVLKHYKRGIALVLVSSASLSLIVLKVWQQVSLILEKVESGGGVIDPKTISAAVKGASSQSDQLIFSLAPLIFILCWVIGMVDAYRIGKKKDLGQP
jgi:hypothetical protein